MQKNLIKLRRVALSFIFHILNRTMATRRDWEIVRESKRERGMETKWNAMLDEETWFSVFIFSTVEHGELLKNKCGIEEDALSDATINLRYFLFLLHFEFNSSILSTTTHLEK